MLPGVKPSRSSAAMSSLSVSRINSALLALGSTTASGLPGNTASRSRSARPV
jgi:hypothetical protein